MANDVRSKEITKTGFIGIITNVFLAAFKAVVGILAGAISVVLDAVNNLTDAISSVITVIGVKLAGKKPTKKHPFGYGRIEYFSAVIIAAIVLSAGVTSLIESVKKIINPEVPDYTAITFIVIGVAIVVKILLGLYVKAKGKKYNSEALKASGSDALFDSIITASTLVCGIIAVATTGKVSLDGIFGTVISLFIIKSGIQMLLEAVSKIMGARTESEVSTGVKQAVLSVDGVNGVYDLVIHNYGPDYALGSIHVEVPASFTADKIHRITKEIQNRVLAEFKIFLTVGVYAYDSKHDNLRKQIEAVAFSKSGVMQVHGVFVDEEAKVLSLDVVVDFSVKDKAEFVKTLTEELSNTIKDYTILINLDTDYSD